MLTYFSRFGLIGCVLVLTGLYGCAPLSPVQQDQQSQVALQSRASYEQIRPAIEKIQAGDAMSKVFEIAIPKTNNMKVHKVRQLGANSKFFVFPMLPGVLTQLNPREYFTLRANQAQGKDITISSMHFGYLDGTMLRPRRILIFENEKVSKIIDNPDVREAAKEPGATTVEVGPLDHFQKQAYEKYFLPNKDLIKPGMNFWEVFSLLHASYIMTSDAQSYVIMCPGYLNYKHPIMAEKTAEGVRAVYPFGYVEGDTERIKWEVEMLNDRVVRLRAREE
jgi:hypothetical protein